jgi:hypothetical protein
MGKGLNAANAAPTTNLRRYMQERTRVIYLVFGDRKNDNSQPFVIEAHRSWGRAAERVVELRGKLGQEYNYWVCQTELYSKPRVKKFNPDVASEWEFDHPAP